MKIQNRDIGEDFSPFLIMHHPVDNKQYWKNVIGECSNIHVIYKGDISPWILNAKALIHNGCTSAIESVIRNTPVISYEPLGFDDMLGIPNKMGNKVRNSEELIREVEKILNLESKSSHQGERKNPILEELIQIESDLSSEKIVKILERTSLVNSKVKIGSINTKLMALSKKAKSTIDLVRNIETKDYDKIDDENLEKKYILSLIKEISQILDVKRPKVKFISKKTLLIE